LLPTLSLFVGWKSYPPVR